MPPTDALNDFRCRFTQAGNSVIIPYARQTATELQGFVNQSFALQPVIS